MAKLETLLHHRHGDPGATQAGECECFCPHGGLIAKSSFEFREQVRDLLRSRLRIAAILMFVLMALHLLRFILTQGEVFSIPATKLAPHLLVTLIEGGLAVSLCGRRQHSLLLLRVIEVVMFLAPALLLIHLQAELVETSPVLSLWKVSETALSSLHAGPDGVALLKESEEELQGLRLLAFSVPWLLLLMVYGLIIPNTWRRATAIVSLFALGPILTAAWVSVGESQMLSQLWEGGAVSFNLLQMGAAAVIAVWGAHRFGTMRREAFDLKHVGVYTLNRRLGSGGMGDVFLAEHRLLKRPCAVKVIRQDREGDASTITRFQNEVQATAQLSHPNTVEIYDYGVTDNGMFFYVMEFLPGMSTQELVERAGPLPAGRVIHLLRQVCGALAEAHRRGLVHRDIKPGNLFAAERGGTHDFAKLLDFGLVKSTGASGESIQHTREGVVVGSPLYAAPETAMGDGTIDARVDIYSLGATAYFLLTGRPVFPGTRALEIVIAHTREIPAPPSDYADVPADLEAVVLRCLAKSPDDRFADVDELEEALSNCRDALRWNSRMAADWWRDFAMTPPQSSLLTADQFAVTTVDTPIVAVG